MIVGIVLHIEGKDSLRSKAGTADTESISQASKLQIKPSP